MNYKSELSSLFCVDSKTVWFEIWFNNFCRKFKKPNCPHWADLLIFNHLLDLNQFTPSKNGIAL